MSVLFSRLSHEEEVSSRPSTPKRHSIPKPPVTNLLQVSLPVIITAAAIILGSFIHRHIRKSTRFSMPEYPTISEASFSRSSPRLPSPPPSDTSHTFTSLDPGSPYSRYQIPPPLPAPTIRRYPDSQERAVPEMAENIHNAGLSQEARLEAQSDDQYDRYRPTRLPPPWVPGRTDTVVKLDGYRRHVMVIESEPFRRGSTG